MGDPIEACAEVVDGADGSQLGLKNANGFARDGCLCQQTADVQVPSYGQSLALPLCTARCSKPH